MILTEDKLIDYVEYKNGLLLTRKTSNINTFNIKESPAKTLVCITGYKEIITYFFQNIIPYFRNSIVLIIIETDIVYLELEWLEHKNIEYCYTWNKPFHHYKLYALPIGLNYKRQFLSISTWLCNKKDVENKKLLCINCDPNTNENRKKYINKAREEWSSFCELIESLKPLSSNIIPSIVDREIKINVTNPECYDKWIEYKFILSPPGTGFDCHRTWEAVLVGVIPIVLSSTLNELYYNLPILVVDTYDIITEHFLNIEYDKIINKIMNKKYNMNQLELEYWINKIENK